MTTTGRCNAVNQTDNERSREPIAKQQNLFLLESGRFRIDWWNRCEYRCESVWCVIKFYLPITCTYMRMYECIVFTTQVTALRCPTKSLSHFQPSRSMICAVGPPPFIACADTRYWPSGDHDNRSTCVVPPQSSNGSVMVCWQPQSDVRHIRTLRSSLCEARNLPTCNDNNCITMIMW